MLSPGTVTRDGLAVALSSRGDRLSEARFSLTSGETTEGFTFDLPLELRNQVSRIEIVGERSAGAVQLLDAGTRWNRIGLVSGASREKAQPLLSPLHYLERALGPFAELVKEDAASQANPVDSLLKQGVTVLILADIGKLVGGTLEATEKWIEEGGVLVRFAGPRLEQGGDELLPVALRTGGRSLGGALSWSEPQPLTPFDETSIFAGLQIPEDVRVNRQVLADPALMGDETLVWARLADGTPLVTATKRKQGYLILFHITANTDWSNLPISGMFVDMLQRITALTGLASIEGHERRGLAGRKRAAARPRADAQRLWRARAAAGDRPSAADRGGHRARPRCLPSAGLLRPARQASRTQHDRCALQARTACRDAAGRRRHRLSGRGGDRAEAELPRHCARADLPRRDRGAAAAARDLPAAGARRDGRCVLLGARFGVRRSADRCACPDHGTLRRRHLRARSRACARASPMS